jgi:serine/threonine protein kinase
MCGTTIAEVSQAQEQCRRYSTTPAAGEQPEGHLARRVPCDGEADRPGGLVGDGRRFSIETLVGRGCFGEVWRGRDAETDTSVAVKFEAVRISGGMSNSLAQELQAVQMLQAFKATPPQGVAAYLHSGRAGSNYCIVMELLGKSLEDCKRECQGQIPPDGAAFIAEQVVTRLEYIHSRGLIHRDIKPENFLFGVGNKIHHLYVIDFGLSNVYWDKRHVEKRYYGAMLGTSRYASIGAHRGFEQSRRDDLEAAGHMLMYLLRGSLPWSGIRARSASESGRLVGRKKEQTPLDDLCAGFPIAFKAYLQEVRSLGFSERPDYAHLKGLFREFQEQRGVDSSAPAFKWLGVNTQGGFEDEPLEPLQRCTYEQPDSAYVAKKRSVRWARFWRQPWNPLKSETLALMATICAGDIYGSRSLFESEMS